MKLLFALACALPGLMAEEASTWQIHGHRSSRLPLIEERP
jgi:hypothetical protein